MSINIRQKGANGEREIIKHLEPIIRRVMQEGGFALPDVGIVQRNQNQSAVGGSDLSNTFGLAIEVKRQEQLSINTWWNQCDAAAKRNGEVPVLLYRQNHKAWRCVMMGALGLPQSQGQGELTMRVRVEISFDEFLQWFEQWVRRKLVIDGTMRV